MFKLSHYNDDNYISIVKKPSSSWFFSTFSAVVFLIYKIIFALVRREKKWHHEGAKDRIQWISCTEDWCSEKAV